jgi:hypothetical protein
VVRVVHELCLACEVVEVACFMELIFDGQSRVATAPAEQEA